MWTSLDTIWQVWTKVQVLKHFAVPEPKPYNQFCHKLFCIIHAYIFFQSIVKKGSIIEPYYLFDNCEIVYSSMQELEIGKYRVEIEIITDESKYK